MRFYAALSVVVVLSLSSPINVAAFAADAKPTTARSKQPARLGRLLARPAPKDGPAAGYAKTDTITEARNELGQTVYSVSPSHFDISPPLHEMAVTAVSGQITEEEPSAHAYPPASRILRSDRHDPVVQAAVPSSDRTLDQSGVTPAAPTTGFNFVGVGFNNSVYVSDANGSVGGDQFFETVNMQYQVWSLDRSTHTATSVLGPADLTSLWTGFGGPCGTVRTYDVVVLYDKTAKRWVISRPTSDDSGEFVCVAVSTTQDATGPYARYAFGMPAGLFADYPHMGVWPPLAYFMSVHAFSPYQAMYAALDRTKMLAADPTAKWLVILDPNQNVYSDDFGYLPADLDGFALPPTQAPGIFASLHPEGIYIYRMKVNFSGAGSSSKTLQAIVPIASEAPACGGGGCIPQPGFAKTLDARSSGLMFRAAYRNFIDHESLVLTHAVDPSVLGIASGVRWYDIRLSGNPDATCPSYPCMYQQGTIADVPNGRSRWTSSAAMDSAENMIVGYSASGTSDGIDNHSIRYTGRAKADPPGTMTAPEAIVATGTANADGPYGAWGDYSSLSVDPSDDCTFWYVNQYYTSFNVWATQVASAAFPPGSGVGQCLASTCNTRPAQTPQIGTPTVPGNNQIRLSWTAIATTPGAYVLERADGTCVNSNLLRPLIAVPGTITSFTDTTVQGGLTYSYRVRAATDASGRCEALTAGACVNATATGACNLKPSFSGAASVTSAQQSNCGLTISWAPGASRCPLSPNVRYSVFRGRVPDFVPSSVNRIATCISGPSSYVDSDSLSSGTTYYYVVRAEDDSSGNGGECGGNEETNVAMVSATPYASGTQQTPGTWSDGGGDGTTLLVLNAAESGDTLDATRRVVSTANDPGANHTPGGAYAYRNAGPAGANVYRPYSCTEVQTPPLTAAASTVNLGYWERHQFEYHVDGVAVEYSVNGGAWTDAPAPSNSPGDGCDPADATNDWEPLSCTQRQSNNACKFEGTKPVFTGPSGGGTSCSDFTTSPTVPAYAHRCHRIAGLNSSDTIKFRWRFSSDSGAGYAGLYLDDVAVTNVRVPSACAPNTCVGQPNGTSCDDGVSCTTNDTCAGNACAGTPIADPALYLRAQADKTTYLWDATPNAQRYDVVRGALGALPVGPGGADETCFDNLATPVLTDPNLPAPNTGFWYVSRAEYACGPGSFGQRSDSSERITATCP